MKNAWRIPLRIVFYRDGDAWVARCLEFDLCGDGDTKREALANLHEAISLQLEFSLEHDNPANLFSPADPKFHQMYFAGKDVALGELELRFDLHRGDVSIEDVHYREYDGRGELNHQDFVTC